MYTIDSVEKLKSPFCCYCIFLNYKKIVEEDYLEKNKTIFNPYHFLCWLNGRGDITNEQLEKAVNMEQLTLKDVFQEILFPNTSGKSLLAGIKKYSLMAEYISQFSTTRQKLWDSVHDKATGFENNKFVTDNNGISLACISDERDVEGEFIHYKESVMIKKLKTDLTKKEQYFLGSELTSEESDIFI